MVKFSVIGSCVSRDVLSTLEGITIGPYAARSSIISITSPATSVAYDDLTLKPETNDWYKRVLETDFDKTHAEMFRAMVGGYVVIDLIEERASVAEVNPGAYVTLSQVLTSFTDFADTVSHRRIPVFSREGQELWNLALPRFAQMVTDYIPLDRIIIHRAVYSGGDEVSASKNSYLNPMYDALERYFPDAWVVMKPARANPDHKWGYAPFHYADDYYFGIAESICGYAGAPFKAKDGFTYSKCSAPA